MDKILIETPHQYARVRLYWLFVLPLVLTAVGCRGSSTVDGTVSYNGAAVDAGQVVFKPKSSGTKPAAGKVTSEGKFELRTAGDKPLAPGVYSVIYIPPPDREDEDGNVISKSKWSDLVGPEENISIESGHNALELELRSK